MLHRAHPFYRRQFGDEDFQFGFEIALGAAYHQAADAGEVLVTAERIKDKDADTWVREWTATGEAAESAMRDAAGAGRRVSALAHARRAATYFSTALYAIDHSSQAGDKLDLWRRQRACWDQVVDLSEGERIAIPYEDTTLPGFLFRAPGAGPGEARPVVVVNNGSDGPTSHMWVQGGASAAARGYHWMTFDGPGQQAALFEQGIPFRPDWEAVLTPVVDVLVARPDVDGDRIAVIGVSQAGYWVPRALAFEHRFAAAVADPGVVDVSTSWTEHLPGSMRKELEAGERDKFDRNMHIGEMFDKSAKALLAFRGEPYGLESDSPYDLYKAVDAYKLGDEVGQIETPLLITDPEGEQFWPGQSQELFDRLGGDKELAQFREADGAGRHCEPLAPGQRDARVFDWLDGYLS
jgi:prolyl oligopeptidase family protein